MAVRTECSTTVLPPCHRQRPQLPPTAKVTADGHGYRQRPQYRRQPRHRRQRRLPPTATATADNHGYRRQPRLPPTATATADSHGYRRRPQPRPPDFSVGPSTTKKFLIIWSIGRAAPVFDRLLLHRAVEDERSVVRLLFHRKRNRDQPQQEANGS